MTHKPQAAAGFCRRKYSKRTSDFSTTCLSVHHHIHNQFCSCFRCKCAAENGRALPVTVLVQCLHYCNLGSWPLRCCISNPQCLVTANVYISTQSKQTIMPHWKTLSDMETLGTADMKVLQNTLQGHHSLIINLCRTLQMFKANLYPRLSIVV